MQNYPHLLMDLKDQPNHNSAARPANIIEKCMAKAQSIYMMAAFKPKHDLSAIKHSTYTGQFQAGHLS